MAEIMEMHDCGILVGHFWAILDMEVKLESTSCPEHMDTRFNRMKLFSFARLKFPVSSLLAQQYERDGIGGIS